MDEHHRNLLRRHTVNFLRDLEPIKILPHLISVLDQDDEQQIKTKPTRKEQVDTMLDILPRRGPLAFQCYIEALEKVQPHLGESLREDEEKEKKLLEVTTELVRERGKSAKLRDELRIANVSLESGKTRDDSTRKELKELKSLHQALLHQSKSEKEKLMFNIKDLNNAKNKLSRDLEVEKQKKSAFQNKCSKLENELYNKNKEIESLKFDFQRRSQHPTNTGQSGQLNSIRKLSAEETRSREKYVLRTYSENSGLINRVPCKDAKEDIPQISENNNVEVLYHQCEETVECMQHIAKLMELERTLDQVTSEKDLALESCKKLKEQVKSYEEKKKQRSDKSTDPMEDSGIHTCIICIKHQSEYEELQQQMEKEVCRLKEEKRKVECTLKEMSDKYEREKKNLEEKLKKLEEFYSTSKQDSANEIKNMRNEMTEQHFNEMKDMKNAKEDLASQVERDRNTISRLRSDLDKERDASRTTRKDFETLKKKSTSEKKQLKKKLEEEIKAKGLSLKEVEAELKKLQEEERKNLEDIGKLKATIREQQDIQEQLKDDLRRWKTLPGRVFNYKTDFDRNGIIYALATSFNTTRFINPASENNYRIKVSRSTCDQGHPMDILDHRKGTLSCTADVENSWWQVDLGEKHALFVTHYTLRHGHDNGLSVVRNWNLEGSRDGRNWKILRKHENDRELKGKGTYPFYIGTWAVEGKVEAMRYFRIHQTGKNSTGRYALYLSGFEIYGVLLEL